MRVLLFTLVALISFSTYAQNEAIIDNWFLSYYTSYQDLDNQENNYREDASFKIYLFVDADNSGKVTIQDMRTPEKIQTYLIDDLDGTGEMDGIMLIAYHAIALHYNSSDETKVVLYINAENQLKLMISEGPISQAYHNLEEQ